MFQPREVVYGYAKNLFSPHNKYIVTIYQDDDLNIVACFTTSKRRAGVPEDQVHHGAIYRDQECVSYVFEKDKVVGINPTNGADFAFPCRSVVTFDYGVKEGIKESFMEEFNNPQVVCVLNDSEYIDLVYAMYRSPHTKVCHKNILDKILQKYYDDKKD